MFSISRKQLIKALAVLPFAIAALLYGGGYISQFLYNHHVWQQAGGTLYSGTSPEFPDPGFLPCILAAFRFPYGLYGVGICVAVIGILVFMVMRMGYSETGEYDRDRNLIYSNKGTYGTAGFMTKKEMKGVLDLVPDIRKHHGTILGELDGRSASRRTPGSTAISPCTGPPAQKRPGPSVSI